MYIAKHTLLHIILVSSLHGFYIMLVTLNVMYVRISICWVVRMCYMQCAFKQMQEQIIMICTYN